LAKSHTLRKTRVFFFIFGQNYELFFMLVNYEYLCLDRAGRVTTCTIEKARLHITWFPASSPTSSTVLEVPTADSLDGERRARAVGGQRLPRPTLRAFSAPKVARGFNRLTL